MTLIQPSRMAMKADVDRAEPHALPVVCSVLNDNGITRYLWHVALR